MDQHQRMDSFADLQAEMHRSRLAWITSELQRRGDNADPAVTKRQIDESAARAGTLYMRLDWYVRAAFTIAARPAIKYVVDAVLASGLIPPPIPEDPRERALYLRKHRNTGPDRQRALDGRRRR